jgi:predicted methyltransferase
MRQALLRILPLLLLRLGQPAVGEGTAAHAAPGASSTINQPFAGPDLSHWPSIFERPGREVFDQRFQILAAIRLEGGMRVADIGAGTGLFSTLFARAVGPSGRVYAVDVSPGFVSTISGRARAEGLTNILALQNTQKDTGLEPESIDLAFVCDTYHHFEDPAAMLSSIHRALVPGGTLIIIDYERRPDRSSPWVLSHVRAGREQVAREVRAAGFRLVEEPAILRDNYFLRFEKGERASPP